jgi:hypothetical protein
MKTVKAVTVYVMILGLLPLMLVGCIGTAPVQAPKSPMYAKWKAPLSTEFNNTDLGNKVGRSSNETYLFGLFSTGDMSIAQAAQNAKIKNIKHAEYEYQNVFFFTYQKTTVIVYGD